MILWLPYNEKYQEIDISRYEVHEKNEVKPDDELIEGWEWRKFEIREVE